jgi:hypothetical protein
MHDNLSQQYKDGNLEPVMADMLREGDLVCVCHKMEDSLCEGLPVKHVWRGRFLQASATVRQTMLKNNNTN